MRQNDFLTRQILYTILARGASTALNFLIALLVARHCGPSIKGEVTLLITTVWFFIFLSNILGGQALIYLLPRNRSEQLLIPAYIWCFIVSVIGFAFLKFSSLIAVQHITSVIIISFFSSITALHQTLLYARKQIYHANLLQVIPLGIVVIGLAINFYVLQTENVFAYIISAGVGYFISTIISFALVIREFNLSHIKERVDWSEVLLSLQHGFLFQLVEVLQLLNLRYYFFQLGNQQGMQYLGIFSVGISVLESVWLIPRSINTVNYIHISHQSSHADSYRETLLLLKINYIWCALALVALFLIPPQVYTWVFGNGFAEVKHAVRFLFPGIWIYSGWWVLFSYYSGVGKYKPLIVSSALGALVLVVLSHYLLPLYVMSGAGLAATFSFTVATFVLGIYFFVLDKNGKH